MKGKDVLFSKDSNEHETPEWLFKKLHKLYKFTLDPCATKDNAKCALYYTKEQNGLEQSWKGQRVFINPPYSKEKDDPTSSGAAEWVGKALYEVAYNNCKVAVLLLPSRTDREWFTRSVLPYANKIIWIEGRLKFVGQANSAPFPSVIVVFEHGKLGLDYNYEVWSNREEKETVV